MVRTVDESLRALGIPAPSRVRAWANRVAVVLFVAGLVALGVRWYQSRQDDGPRYETAAVTRAELVATVTATGTLNPSRTVDVGPEISGRVRAVHVEPNDVVEVGDLLAEIDTTTIDAQIAEARANVQQTQAATRLARAVLADARLSLTRVEQLHTRQLASDQERDAARSAVTRTEAELDGAIARTAVARAALERAQTDLGRARILSPIAGVILMRSVEPGQSVAATLSAPVFFQIAESLSSLELHIDIDEADVGSVHEGQEATFVVDAHEEQVFHATIARLHFAAHTVSTVVSYEAELAVDNAAGLLRPGMTATATVITDRRAADLVVPNAALRFAPPVTPGFGAARRQDVPEGPVVWTLERGHPVVHSVETTGSDGRNTAIHGAGIEEGTQVIIGLARETETAE
jgi:HlyD family secretion protein